MPHDAFTRPIIFTDLDDTLFQTLRKIPGPQAQQPLAVGALDRDLAPRSFMMARQANLVQWMLAQAETIPVTARGTDELARVCIPFDSYAITTHGAVILTPQGEPDASWQAQISAQLAPYQTRLAALQQHVSTLLADPQAQDAHLPTAPGWCRMCQEYGIPIYLVMKVKESSQLEALNRYADWVAQTFDLDGFYVHRNGNNIAWLPNCIDKGHAVRYLLARLHEHAPDRPVLGFGDSLTDFSFMQQCDFLALPQRSQVLALLQDALSRH
ncbi:hypothetical protein [Nissabacter sp. SGAir0207]|uniref:hypothetical protein n=1 Tax=Nissabacter sp. SGAir0207 TaxID=2126321 RepID=UPI0010CCDF4D|nr:hypothetical protein [Nissabacter sp. SGAir0207]QCR38529.1 hypothetical protein C1N62_20595 [Nissabacter sp. SGAir0207]